MHLCNLLKAYENDFKHNSTSRFSTVCKKWYIKLSCIYCSFYEIVVIKCVSYFKCPEYFTTPNILEEHKDNTVKDTTVKNNFGILKYVKTVKTDVLVIFSLLSDVL